MEPTKGLFLEALWLLALGDEPTVGFDNPFGTKAGLSCAKAVMDLTDGWTNERNDDGVCIIGTRMAACFLYPYKCGGDRRPGSPLGIPKQAQEE